MCLALAIGKALGDHIHWLVGVGSRTKVRPYKGLSEVKCIYFFQLLIVLFGPNKSTK